MTAAVTAGTEMIHLLRAARLISLGPQLNLAFDAFSEGRCTAVVEALALLDGRLAVLDLPGRRIRRIVRARASILTLKELLSQHAPYFCLRDHQ